MVDFTPPDETREFISALIKFIEREIIPLENQYKDLLFDEKKLYDDKGYLVKEVLELRKYVRKKSAEAGFLNAFVPQELGGAGMGAITAAFMNFEIYKKYGPGRILIGSGKGLLTTLIIASFIDGVSPLFLGAKERIRKEYVPKILSGDITGCFALSEPEAGSDFWNMKTYAERRNGRWIINGVKQWITNGPYADYAIVFAVTDRELVKQRRGGISAFFVEKERGWKVSAVVPTMGHIGSDTATIELQDVEVPDENIIGDVNQGFYYAMLGISLGRVAIGAKCVGLSEWALLQSLEYAKQRKAFGEPISELQAIQFMLADIYIKIYSAKTMTLHCAWKIEKGEQPIKEISAVKAYCVEVCQEVFDKAIQIMGGMGLTNEARLEEGFRLARTLRIPDGTSEIQRRTIARRLLKGDTE